MVASKAARQRKAAAEAGPLAKVAIAVGSDGQFVCKISCTRCVVKDRRQWSAYRSGQDNGYMAEMDRWTFHLVEKHPEDPAAPCLAYLGEAQQRLEERRRQRTADGQ